MLIFLWVWQSAVVQFTYKTIPYSEFKEHLRNGEVAECTVKEDTIEGKIVPKPASAHALINLHSESAIPPASAPSNSTQAASELLSSNASPNAASEHRESKPQLSASDSTTNNTTSSIPAAAPAKPFFFRTVRVEDPDLVRELEQARVSFHGERPGFL